WEGLSVSRHFTCPQGHQWDLSATSSSLSAHLDPVCPVCGAPAHVSAPDLAGKSDSGSVVLSLGPAPVEAKARVPAPLPVRESTLSSVPPVVPRPHDVSAAPRSTRAPRPRELTETDVAEPTAPGSWIRHPLFVALATLACLLPLLVMTAFVLPHARIAEARREAEEARDRAFQAEAAMRQ